MEKQYVVQFLAQTTDITPMAIFGPFANVKYAEAFIEADIEEGKKFMDEHCRGYGRTVKWENSRILPGYGEWKIVELVRPYCQTQFPEHCKDF